jgi:thiaminase
VFESLAAGTLPRERYDIFLKLKIRYLRETEKRAAWQDHKKIGCGDHHVFRKKD